MIIVKMLQIFKQSSLHETVNHILFEPQKVIAKKPNVRFPDLKNQNL